MSRILQQPPPLAVKNIYISIQRGLRAKKAGPARPKRAGPEGTTHYNLPLNATPHQRGNAGP
jgi:hypothetical protein